MTTVGSAPRCEPMIIAVSAAMRQVLARARSFASRPVPVLIVGPTGAGKELVARYVEYHSGRPGPMVDVDCGTLSRELAESVLFGHRRGAFTGATEDTPGLIATSNGGTLWLDELCSLTPELQPKFLRVLETGELRRVGETTKIKVDFRLICTAQEDIDRRVDEGRFRLDLYQRLCVVRIDIPPLCERPADILPLAQYYANACDATLGADAEGVLLAHAWPGNVRELRATIIRSGAEADGRPITAALLRASLGERRWSGPHQAEVVDLFRAKVEHAVAQHGWHRTRIARVLGMSVPTLYRKLGAAGMSPKELARLQPSRAVFEKTEACSPSDTERAG